MANQLQMHQQEMSYSAFESEVEDGNVTNVYINQNSAVPTGTVSVTLKDDDTARRVNVSDVREVQKLLDEHKIDYGMSDVPRESIIDLVLIKKFLYLSDIRDIDSPCSIIVLQR